MAIEAQEITMKTAQKTDMLRDLHERTTRMEEKLVLLYRNAEDLYYSKLKEHKVYERKYKEKVGQVANGIDYCIKQIRELEQYVEELALFKHGTRL
jgi:hypothetical protein